jgi:hypothetical protein
MESIAVQTLFEAKYKDKSDTPMVIHGPYGVVETDIIRLLVSLEIVLFTIICSFNEHS